MQNWKRFLILGCATTFILFFLLVGFGYFYMVGKVPIQLDHQIAHADAVSYVRFYIEDRDSPSSVVLQAALAEYVRKTVERSHSPNSDMQIEAEGLATEDLQTIQEFVPKMVPAILETNDFGEEQGFAMRFTASGYGNMQRLLWHFIWSSDGENKKSNYRDYNVLNMDNQTWATFAHGDFILSDSITAMEKTLDQYSQAQAQTERSPMADVDQDAVFKGFTLSPAFLGSLSQQDVQAQQTLTGFTRMAWSANITESESAELLIQIDVPPSAEVAQFLRDFIQSQESASGTQWQAQIQARDNGYRIDATIAQSAVLMVYFTELFSKEQTL